MTTDTKEVDIPLFSGGHDFRDSSHSQMRFDLYVQNKKIIKVIKIIKIID